MTKNFREDRQRFPGFQAEFRAGENVIEAGGDSTAFYRLAFENYKWWTLQAPARPEAPTTADALAITKALRDKGNFACCSLAERIEKVCRIVPLQIR